MAEQERALADINEICREYVSLEVMWSQGQLGYQLQIGD